MGKCPATSRHGHRDEIEGVQGDDRVVVSAFFRIFSFVKTFLRVGQVTCLSNAAKQQLGNQTPRMNHTLPEKTRTQVLSGVATEAKKRRVDWVVFAQTPRNLLDEFDAVAEGEPLQQSGFQTPIAGKRKAAHQCTTLSQGQPMRKASKCAVSSGS